MMRKFWIGLVIALISVGLVWGGPWGGDAKRTAEVGPIMSLGLRGHAEILASPESTFPSDLAGLAAYVNIGASLDLEQAATAFASLIRQGGNWVVGGVPVTILPPWDIRGTRTINVPVYVDSEGWVVAYLPRSGGWYSANIMLWTAVDQEDPQLDGITTTSLEEAINQVLVAVGIDFAPLRGQVDYYDFEFPDAEKIILAAKVEKTQVDTPVEMQMTIAEGAQIYRASVSVTAESDLLFSPHEGYSYSAANCWCSPPVSAFPVTPSNFPVGSVWACGFRTGIPEGETVGIAVIVVYSTP